ncbi:GGDEF domain-containing protein [Aliikangiella sp. IMCC44359]|uniref:GGDEF domain-containing protein n=1 Tax=Aliikangiella sp. IMCC44359 TaxID=3459125 RepID=UPI00403A8956
MINEIDNFKYKVRLYLTSFGSVNAIIFFILQLYSAQYFSSFISLFSFFYFGFVVYLLYKNNHYLWEGRGVAVILSIAFLNVMYIHPEYGVFWAYVLITYIFLLMKINEAFLVTCIFIPATYYIVSPYFHTPTLIRIYSTLTLVAMFGCVVSILIERLLTKVNSLITHDPLTKALNKHTFHSSLENALGSLQRYKTPATLFIFDLDLFKNINDTYGHQTGDIVLKGVSSAILKRLRESDRLFRYGGEEFAVLLSQTNQNEGEKLAEELRKIVEEQDFDLGHPVTISGGISEVQESDQINSWIERCDKALYEAKSNGRNKVVLG